jgi:large subunit ribosomal protein L2
MAVRLIKQNTAAARNMSMADFSVLTKKKPEKSLLVAKKQQSGRNNQGRITIRHRGGGARRAIRMVDSLGSFEKAEVKAIEYDPNRSAYLALLQSEMGEKGYVIATQGMKVGRTIASGSDVEVKSGNRMPLHAIPAGSVISNVELQPGRGAQMARTAGARAQVVAKEGKFVQVKLPSSEVRLVNENCMATIGQVGNSDHGNNKIGSAGRKRRMGIRPTVRGKAMNPVDHPHGGGEGGTSIGLKNPKTPWGLPALGRKTRRRKYSNAMIVRGRKRGKR